MRKGVNGSDGDAEWARDGGGEGKRRRSMGESRLSATDVVDAAARGEREGVAENGLREGGEQQEEVAVERKCLKLRLYVRYPSLSLLPPSRDHILEIQA